MDFNGQKRFLDHAINTRFDAMTAGQKQKELNAYRRTRVLEGQKTRPVLLPLVYNMTAAGQVGAYRDTTPRLTYDVIITGIKSDSQTRDIIVKNAASEASITLTGNETDLYLRADEIAGQVPGNGGQTGVFNLTTPLIIPAGNRLTVEMFKTDTTGDVEMANIVLIGLRVIHNRYSLPDYDSDLIDRAIVLRDIPTTRFLKVKFDFDSAIAGGEARNISTPTSDEPLIIRGIRTSLRNSLVEIGVEGEASWTVEPTPCWAVAGEDEGGYENYIWLPKPIYLPARSAVEIRRVVNSINGSNPLDSETNNTMTFICETL